MAEGTRGILTETDRKVLGENAQDVSDRTKEQRRIRLRSRIRKAIVDFGVIFTELPPEDRKYIFSPGPRSEVSPSAVTKSVTDMAAFAFLGMAQLTGEDIAEDNMESVIDMAKEKLQLEAKSQEIDELLERHKSGEELSHDEVSQLLNAATLGHLELSEVRDAIE